MFSTVDRPDPVPEKVGFTEFDSRDWLRVTVVLEAVQSKKKIKHFSKLAPVCFQILSRCVVLVYHITDLVFNVIEPLPIW